MSLRSIELNCSGKWDKLCQIGLKISHYPKFCVVLFVWFSSPVSLSMSTFCSSAECLPSLHTPVVHDTYCSWERCLFCLWLFFCASFSPGCGNVFWVHFTPMVSSLLTSCAVSQCLWVHCCTACQLFMHYFMQPHIHSWIIVVFSDTEEVVQSFVIFFLLCKVVVSFWN